jgi:hypothetical protein
LIFVGANTLSQRTLATSAPCSADARQSLASRLEFVGCKVNRDGADWLSAGKFADPTAGVVAAKKKAKKKGPRRKR